MSERFDASAFLAACSGRPGVYRMLDADGKLQTQPASLVIVASYTYENIRLLLHSGINKKGPPFRVSL